MSTTEEEVVTDTEEQAPDESEVRAAEQRRIDDDIAEASRERSRVQREAAELLDRATQRLEQAAKPRAEPEEEDKPPVRGDEPYEEYLLKVVQYGHREVRRHVDEQVQAAVALYRENAEEGSFKSRMAESAQRGEEMYPGFQEAIAKVPAMPQAALQAWNELPEPEHVAHYLGTHLDEARKIGKMTPGRAAHAVIALGERLDQERSIKQAKTEEKNTESGEFGPPAGGNRTSGSEPAANMSMEQWEKARFQQKIRAQKG